MNTLFSLEPSHQSSLKKKGTLFCDGGSRGNPGKAAGAIILLDEDRKQIASQGNFYGVQTNNFAEYQALIDGLGVALRNKITFLYVFLDSNLVVEQMKGHWRVKNINIKPLFQNAKHLCDSFEVISFTHIPREKNSRADALVNKVLDKN